MFNRGKSPEAFGKRCRKSLEDYRRECLCASSFILRKKDLIKSNCWLCRPVVLGALGGRKGEPRVFTEELT